MLIHLIDGAQDDPVEAYRVIRHELEAYDEELAKKPEIVAVNKCDALDAEARKKVARAIKKASGQTPHLISGVTGEGVRELLFAALAAIEAGRAAPKAAPSASYNPWDNA